MSDSVTSLVPPSFLQTISQNRQRLVLEAFESFYFLLYRLGQRAEPQLTMSMFQRSPGFRAFILNTRMYLTFYLTQPR